MKVDPLITVVAISDNKVCVTVITDDAELRFVLTDENAKFVGRWLIQEVAYAKESGALVKEMTA